MNEENINKIIQKYKAGESSLEEEKTLFNTINDSEESIQSWASFVKKNTIKTPENLNEKLWDAFEEKTRKPNQLKIRVLSAVASIALILSLFIYNTNKNEMSETQKATLLEEARNMFADAKEEKEVYKKILENELVIVYTKTN